MYFTLFVTVLITAAFLVVAAYAIAKLIGPRSYNPVEGEPLSVVFRPMEPLGASAYRLLSLCNSLSDV